MMKLVLCVLAAALVGAASVPGIAQQASDAPIVVDARAAGTPFPHFWEQMFGSGRANLSLRESYRQDLDRVKKAADFKYVRFHAILDDENGVYSEDARGNAVYNWSYVDQIYDGMLAHGVRPFVEISFMPKALASKEQYHAFWYKPLPVPPKDYAKWDALITAFARHLVDRYGVDEVAQWYFEVWNEPNIDFWVGRPAQETYFELYDHTARALKAANEKIRVGGPATAQAAWVGDMIAHATQNEVPLDFVSTHVYGNDATTDVFHDHREMAPHQMVCAAVDKVHDEIAKSAQPKMPLIWSEYNATYANEQQLTDSIYMGPWLADTIAKCDGKTLMMSYWSFSDVFEEQGVVKTPFYGGYGIVAEDGIPKPAYDVFLLLHGLGEERLPAPVDDALVTRRKDGAIVIAAWNLVEPNKDGSPVSTTAKTVTFELKNIGGGIGLHTVTGMKAEVRRVDAAHGDTLDAWKKMGSPAYPTQAQIEALRKASEPGPDEDVAIRDHKLTLTLPPMGLAVAEIK
ncbi:MAG TPA: glycosyl hydrolase family 39 [Acidobacteriaceae bacterium]|jgi:xylan 1,4-beta-xylosidase|nr:glycosyl hydrolase family 39 [Acidobacteriaceae bacterium]